MKITHADVLRVIKADLRNSTEPLVSDEAITAAFDTARGLVRRVRLSSFDRDAFTLLVNRKTPPSYVGDTVVLALLYEVLEIASDLDEAVRRVGELRAETEALKAGAPT